jgi:cytoskeleton protein RodZ
MLAQDTTFCFGLPGNKTTIEVSLDNLRTVLGQIEVELYRSEVYRRAIDTSQQMATEGTKSTQFLMKAIGREAIRLTLRHFVRQGEAEETKRIQDTEKELDEFPVAAFSRALGSHSSNVTEFPTKAIVKAVQNRSETVAPTITNRVSSIKKQASAKLTPQKGRRKVSAADLAEQAVQERDDQLQKLGEQIKRARLARSMSLAQLHSKTLVPVHQIQALEAGQGAHFPEDIYLRGFVQRICKALEIDSSSLLASLAKPDPEKAILPTWYHPPTKAIGIRGLAVQPVHLYVGYAALMAGGLFWLSRQSAPPAAPGALDLDSSQITPSSKMHSPPSDAKVSISPPETLHP